MGKGGLRKDIEFGGLREVSYEKNVVGPLGISNYLGIHVNTAFIV